MRPIAEQVVVITGASSGIGRETAYEMGRLGASVVLAARSGAALEEVAAEIETLGGRAVAVPTDVARWSDVEALASRAVEAFGRVDTWVNNAAVSEFATVEDMTIDEIDRIVQVDLMGTIYGMKAALPILKRTGAGTIINVASVVGERAVPLQAPYCAAKHGVIGFTDALRLELEREESPIKVTLILPGSINTPFFDHARSRVEGRPRPMPPVYDPSAVARAIVQAAETPQRDVYVGGAARALSLLHRLSPRLADRFLLWRDQGVAKQIGDRAGEQRDVLFDADATEDRVHGAFSDEIRKTGVFKRPYPTRSKTLLALGALAALGGAVLAARRRNALWRAAASLSDVAPRLSEQLTRAAAR